MRIKQIVYWLPRFHAGDSGPAARRSASRVSALFLQIYSGRPALGLDGRAALAFRTIPAMRGLKITKLSDEFGQYVIFIECACGHTRRASPHTLAAFSGWDANLADVVRRLRCSKCNQKKCKARAVELTKPRGYRDERR